MSAWQKQALNRLSTLNALSDGMSASPLPQFGTRGNVARINHLRLASINTDAKPSLDQPLYWTHGSALLGAWWALWGLLGFAMIAQGGGGGWMAFSLFGLLAMLRQSSNLIVISNQTLMLRDGIAGGRTRVYASTSMADVWVHQSLLGRWLNHGRIGLRSEHGEIIWSPVVTKPYEAKHAMVMAITGRRPIGIPPHLQSPLTGV